MGWERKRIQFSGTLPQIVCSQLTAQPYSYGVGQQTPTGNWLSTANAVAWLAQKLARTGGGGELLVMMVCGTTESSYASALTAFSAVMPLPDISRALTQVTANARLQVDRMLIPTDVSSGLSAAAPLLFATGRQAQAADGIQQALGAASLPLSMESMQAGLEAFTAARDTAVAGIAQGLDDLTQKNAEIWVFSGNGLYSQMAVDLLDDVPELTAVQATATMFAGDDLSALRGLVHELN